MENSTSTVILRACNTSTLRSERNYAAKGGLAEAEGIKDGDDGAVGQFGACDVFDGGGAMSGTVTMRLPRRLRSHNVQGVLYSPFTAMLNDG